MKAVQQHAVRHTVEWGSFPRLLLAWRRVALYATLGIGFFSLGFVPFWLKAREATEQRDAAQREVRRNQIQATLAAAVIQAKRGEFEPARQLTSDFFVLLRGQLDSQATNSAFTSEQQTSLRPLLTQRDGLIADLSRGDPASADRLFLVYDSYRRLVRSP